jgi:hypothetical protein
MFPAEPSDINHGTAIRMATIFDSTPGIGEYSTLLKILTTDVKSPLVKAAMTVPGSLVYLACRTRFSGVFCSLLCRQMSRDLISFQS